MAKENPQSAREYQRMIFTLPTPLVAELKKYARACRRGNKSGFVADAVQEYITLLKRQEHTAKLRRSYAAAGRKSKSVAKDWESVDQEQWAALDRHEKAEE